MSHSPLDPLPGDLAALFASEARSYADAPALHASVLHHVEWAAGLAAPLATHAGATAASAVGAAKSVGAPLATTVVATGVGKVTAVAVSALLVGSVLGGVAGRASLGAPAAPKPPTSIVSSGPREPYPVSSAKTDWAAVPEPSAQPAPVPVPASRGSATVVANPSTTAGESSSHGTLTREREMLDVARAALSSGRASDAITTIQRHAQKWPRGYLGEEREVLWIQALVASGRREEAVAKASLFRTTYPTSILQPAVDAALSAAQ